MADKHAGKVPIKKTIVHKGKTMEVTYWVKDKSAGKKNEDAPPAGQPVSAPASPPASSAPPPPAPSPSKGPPPGTVAVKKTITSKSGKTFEVTYHMTEKAAAKYHAKQQQKGGAPAPSPKPAPPTAAGKKGPFAVPPKHDPDIELGHTTSPKPAHHQFLAAVVHSGGKEASYELMASVYDADTKLARRAISDWAASSIDKHAVQLRGAVALDIEREADHIKAAGSNYSREDILLQLRRGRDDPAQKRAVKAMAAISQSMHDDEMVTVYRGIKERQAKTISPQATEVSTGSLVSFSEKAEVAAKFAGYNGIVIKTQVPRSAIAVSHRAFEAKEKDYDSGSLLRGEWEVILHSKGKVSNIKVLTKDEIYEDRLAQHHWRKVGGKVDKGKGPAGLRSSRAGVQMVVRQARAAALRTRLAGRPKAAKFEEALIENGADALARAIAPAVAQVRKLVQSGKSLADIKRQLPGLLRKMETTKTAEPIARSLILAKLSGMAAALEEV